MNEGKKETENKRTNIINKRLIILKVIINSYVMLLYTQLFFVRTNSMLLLPSKKESQMTLLIFLAKEIDNVI